METIIFDFAGTLVKSEIIEEANEFRAKILEKALPTKEEHGSPEQLYKANREFVEKLTGITETMNISYTSNEETSTSLSGKELQNQIATNLFQIGMYMAAKKHGKNILVEGMGDVIKTLRETHHPVIVSGVRTDIISGMFAIAGIEHIEIRGQPPKLGMSNEALGKDLFPSYFVGDKKSDLEAGKALGAKTVWVTWGHASGGEEDIADKTVNVPEELLTLFS